MPVGASVTFGVGSTTGDSYRKDLRDTLTQAGHAVNMVGSHKNGRFADNDVEATSGFVIAQITRAAEASAPKFLPNLVLLEAGTNDCNSGKIVSTAGANVSALVGRLFALSPGATVVMATLLANKVAAQDACRVDVNRQYSAVAAAMAQQQARFVLVDMRGPDAPTTADLNDTRHPNDAGYVKMAAVWSQGVQQALAKGFLSPPADNGIPYVMSLGMPSVKRDNPGGIWNLLLTVDAPTSS
ncbi:GDSL-like Lipase/Acylhydrolase [Lasiosphaeria miniovina]|uniref:GDSL-like Lipase/Acylhydrolase n=1 Tax=Lasiosphaeria miniovina TaxID=1954250 RepID=A0AA40DZ37_9PEZI|nr:GDSL-like Lipase/Acylhydrolase [Lasiosphaeria miniovina]KAK0721849.1 GDSL-like Lipase/Acylhydrolase [Lasiosphaeria miniovina]